MMLCLLEPPTSTLLSEPKLLCTFFSHSPSWGKKKGGGGGEGQVQLLKRKNTVKTSMFCLSVKLHTISKKSGNPLEWRGKTKALPHFYLSVSEPLQLMTLLIPNCCLPPLSSDVSKSLKISGFCVFLLQCNTNNFVEISWQYFNGFQQTRRNEKTGKLSDDFTRRLMNRKYDVNGEKQQH